MKIIRNLAILILTSTSMHAFSGELDDITMDVVDAAKGHRLQVPKHNIVIDYMLENGDITQEQVEAMRAEREAVREELRALKASGDEEALTARRQELRTARQARVDELKAYVADNEELAAAIQDMRERRRTIINERRDRHDNRRDRRERRGQRKDV